MAKTDDQATALGKNVPTQLSNTPATHTFKDAASTAMHFYTGSDENGDPVVRCSAELLVDTTQGDGKVREDVSVRVQDFPVSDALPDSLNALVPLIQVYLHNYAVEKANE